jgi:hypothetical protein
MLTKILRELVLAFNAACALVIIVLVAYLLPGDNTNANVTGSLVMIFLVAVADAAVTLPARAVLSRRGVSLFRG